MIYPGVLNAVVSALAAEAIDNTSKQAWQKLYNSADEEEGGDLATLVRSRGADTIDRTQVDCWVSARLHSALEQKHWDALVAKYSTHKGRKVQAISALQTLIYTPAPKLFLFKATTAWAIPQLKGARPKVATSVSVEIPLDAPEWRREAVVKAALAAGQAKAKRDESRSADMIVLKDSFYDMNTWDNDGTPESTRRRWRLDIGRAADDLVNEALAHAADILEAEGLLIEQAA
ncbi:hypothetical protein SAMN04490189_4644 [Pseudomonas koreensis]|uniref:hypothetical protein n=1 Tax=Pseudomonas koreensis TaxID=198620 RepID=UPI00087C2456|nr:hypothetical protein [Pseudomonas koreensis]KAB0510870.1 hypothetical protein F7R05_21955 [Pseudomonas koreensis]NNA64383.1 hypothetical protein [Pseudomonas koreensis]GGK53146.1 hypothetical protein GCM10009103_54340 [Pseudomonas koreensis]SDE19988.1 hypothetical protein SAMN04490189_4644 [Pseudomonas koreensis]